MLLILVLTSTIFGTSYSTFFEGNVYGTCCGARCGGYEGGKPAIEYWAEGLFNNAPVTEWKRGSTPQVYWKQAAEHRGGYAYRLCKVKFNLKYIAYLNYSVHVNLIYQVLKRCRRKVLLESQRNASTRVT